MGDVNILVKLASNLQALAKATRTAAAAAATAAAAAAAHQRHGDENRSSGTFISLYLCARCLNDSTLCRERFRRQHQTLPLLCRNPMNNL